MPDWAIWLIVGAVVVILLIWVISTYNSFIRMRNKCEEAFSTMDVFLKKRFDLIPNFVETVKGYASHEAKTLESVIAARNAVQASGDNIEERLQNENILQGTLRSLFAVSEAYPDLKANTNFLALQNQLTAIEGEIETSRRYYNGVVNLFNTKTEVFPGNIIAGLFGFKRKPLFEVEAQQRENVKVEF